MDKAIDTKNHPYYREGYARGFAEGRLQMMEQLRDLFLQAESQIPRPILINTKDIDPELLKALLKND